ncbi:MAG: glycosyltransferase [Candidatus Saccharibacteria bacterium]|nr:glycosyltransferase [Candidatus Saccharibacteria bacterium]
MRRTKKVLYLVEDTESAQFRYRVKNVIEALKDSSMWLADSVKTDDFSDSDLDEVDLVVILRQTEKNGKILKAIEAAHKRGLKVLFDLDDLIFDYRDLMVLMKGTGSKNIVYWMGYIWGIKRIAKKVDGFITTNGFLAKKIKRSFSRPCSVILNSLNSKQIKVANESLKDKKHDGFTIGYFSGSPTHTKDLRLIESEIFKFLDKYEDVKLEIVGYVEPSVEMKKRIDDKRVEIFELVDYLEQIRMTAKVDVNIAPLVINDFTNSKSELKFFEAAVVETVTIASPNYSFKKAISDGENGFLARPDEWCNKLEYLYENSSESRKIAKKAYEYVLKNYYGEKFTKEVEEAYNYFLES